MKLTVDYVTSNEYKEHLTVRELLDYMDVEAVPWLIVSVNGLFLKRDKFKEHILNEGDNIELIYVRGGG